MADELIDICDENDNIIGRAMKYEALAKGLWHRSARILVYNSKSQVLTQLRSLLKELHPGKWDIGVAGHVAAGESYVATALREAAEEAGLNFSENDLELVMVEKYTNTSDGLNEKGFAYTYFARFDGDETQLSIQKEEVQLVKFINIDELEFERKKFPEKYVPHSDRYWDELINGVKNKFQRK
jgi:isopentenyl-diphosphate Delta-isomerase